MLVYRIVHKSYSKTLFASGLAGRGNNNGTKIIYSAESIALAFLENTVRRQGLGFNKDFKTMFIEVPDIDQSQIDIGDLPKDWRNSKDYTKCQTFGDRWYNEGKTLILKVPSAILPETFNYIINTQHPDYKLVKIIAVTDLIPDERIEDILKMYPVKTRR